MCKYYILNINFIIIEQPHPRSLISVFVFHCLDSVIPILAFSKISRLQHASVAEQAGLNHTWSQNPEDRFSRDVALFRNVILFADRG